MKIRCEQPFSSKKCFFRGRNLKVWTFYLLWPQLNNLKRQQVKIFYEANFSLTILKTLDYPLTLHIATKLSVEFSEKSDSSQWKVDLEKDFHLLPFKLFVTKGQLISKCPFGVIVWTKIPMKIFPGFLP